MPMLVARQPRPSLTVGFFNFLVKEQIPVIASQTLLVAELIRKLPVDIRMGNRAYKRGRFNASELLYFSITAFALVAIILDCLLQESTALGTPKGCRMTSTASIFLWYASSTLVAAALAWRTYVIFGRGRLAGRWLLGGLTIQTTAMITAVCRAHKYIILNDGYCDFDVTQFLDLRKPWYHLASPWFVLINFLFDVSTVAASTWKLVTSARSPLGFSGLARILIANGVQYACLVCTTNLVEFILIASAEHKIPSLLNMSITIQIITGMNLISDEQDAVHGHTRSYLTGSRRRANGSDKAPGSPPANKPNMTRYTGSISGFGSKESGYPSTGCCEDAIQMHTCIDIDVDSGRCSNHSADEYCPPHQQDQQQPPRPSFEITMGTHPRRNNTLAPDVASSGIPKSQPLPGIQPRSTSLPYTPLVSGEKSTDTKRTTMSTSAESMAATATEAQELVVNEQATYPPSLRRHRTSASSSSSSAASFSPKHQQPSSPRRMQSAASNELKLNEAKGPAASGNLSIDAAKAQGQGAPQGGGGVSIRSIRSAMGPNVGGDMTIFSCPSSARADSRRADPAWPRQI
ncbi:hypothetical protein V8E36_001935 [Tilletia maclaganii]